MVYVTNDKCEFMELNDGKSKSIIDKINKIEHISMADAVGSRHDMLKIKLHRVLGVNISDNLKWSEHIQLITNKAYASLGILKRTFKTWTTASFAKLYTAFVRPKLEYCTLI
jgi:hypothetical protein